MAFVGGHFHALCGYTDAPYKGKCIFEKVILIKGMFSKTVFIKNIVVFKSSMDIIFQYTTTRLIFYRQKFEVLPAN